MNANRPGFAPEPKSSDEDMVRGERASPSVHRASAQTRLSTLLALGFMVALGLAALSWYYAQVMTRQTRARQDAQAQARSAGAPGDTPLPPLGRVDPPVPAAAPALAESAAHDTPPPLPMVLDEIPAPYGAAVPAPYGAAVPASGYVPPQSKTPAQLALERQLGGTVFLAQGAERGPASAGSPPSADDSGTAKPDDVSALMRPSATPAARAQVLPTQRLLLPKGAFIDCTLETAIDSTLPGMTTCILATDTFGADGKVVLLERGTKLVGETKGQLQQGAARVFVLWTEARTPTGVIVPLASPGADELGRAGLAGTVDRHFWERFGAALLVSIVDGGVQAAVQSSRGGGTVIYDPSTSQNVGTEVLKSTVNIPPTVVKHQGDRIAVLVARDLDFRSVYELRSIAGTPNAPTGF